jgi:hypothetical protein
MFGISQERNCALPSRLMQSFTTMLDCVPALGKHNALWATAILILFTTRSTAYKAHSQEGRLPSSRCIRSAHTRCLNRSSLLVGASDTALGLMDLNNFWLTRHPPQSAVGALRNSHRLHCGFNTQRCMSFLLLSASALRPSRWNCFRICTHVCAALRPGLKSCFMAVLTQS